MHFIAATCFESTRVRRKDAATCTIAWCKKCVYYGVVGANEIRICTPALVLVTGAEVDIYGTTRC